MKCTLVDTGPLVALFDERDQLHPRALNQLSHAPEPRLLCASVVTESIFLLGSVGARRITASLDRGVFVLRNSPTWDTVGPRALRWLQRYESHDPDFNDALLIAWYEVEAGARIWTFDSEFRTTWRTSKGKAPRLVE